MQIKWEPDRVSNACAAVASEQPTSIQLAFKCFYLLWRQLACVFVGRFYLSHKSEQVVQIEDGHWAITLSIVMKLSFLYLLILISDVYSGKCFLHGHADLGHCRGGWTTSTKIVIICVRLENAVSKQRHHHLRTGIRQPHSQLKAKICFYFACAVGNDHQ